MFQSIGTIGGAIVLSQGRAGLHFGLQILGTSITVIAICVGLKWGINGVAFCYALQSTIWVHSVFFVTNGLIKLRYSDFYSQLYSAYISSGTMLLFLILGKWILPLDGWGELICLISVGGFGYFLGLVMMREISFTNHRVSIRLMA